MEQLQTENSAAGGLSDLTAGLEALRKLARRYHYYCEDSWYSCPKAEDGSANDSKGDDCDCGADDHNAEVERVFSETMRIASNAEVTGAGRTAKKIDSRNVFAFPATTTMTPEQALRSALGFATNDNLQDVLVVGYDGDGALLVRSSRMDRKEALWLSEQLRRYALGDVA